MKKFVENHKKEIKAFFFASLAVLFAGIVLESMSCSTSASVADSNSALQSSDSASGQTNLGSEVSTFNSDDTLDVTNYTWSGYTPNLLSRDITETDLVENASFSSEIYFNLADLSVSSDGVSFTPLEDGGSSVEASSIGLSLSNGLVTVTSSDTFKMNISGTANDSVAFYFSNKKGKDVSLVLNDAVFASGNYPCIEFAKKAKCYLVAKGSSYLTDGRNYGTNYASDGTGAFSEGLSSSKKGSIYVKGILVLSGDGASSTSGSLSVYQNYKHGFFATDYITVNGGSFYVSSTGRDGFRSENGFVMNDGAINIEGTGTHANNESRGIVVEGWDYDTEDSEANEYPGEGFIVIKGGSITTTTVSKGICAKWDIDDDAGTPSDTTDDPYPYVWISAGNVSVTTTGTPKDESSSYYDITDADGVVTSEKKKLSPEGIEGKQAVFITGGVVSVNTTDDCINASRDSSGKAGAVVINGGNVFAYSSGNDAIDSNGSICINGGVVVALTNTTPECAIDCDSNTFAVTGGLFAAIGTTNYSEPTSSACSQSVICLSGSHFCGGKNLVIEDSSSNPVFVYAIPTIFGTSSNSNYVMLLSSPKISSSATYKAVSGASASGGEYFHGLYTGLPAVSGGSTTVSSINASYVYKDSGISNGGPQEGPHPW